MRRFLIESISASRINRTESARVSSLAAAALSGFLGGFPMRTLTLLCASTSAAIKAYMRWSVYRLSNERGNVYETPACHVTMSVLLVLGKMVTDPSGLSWMSPSRR